MGNNITISLLHVEDDNDYALYFKSVFLQANLGKLRFRISRVSTLSEAIKYLKVAKPNLVVLDLKLPDCEGLSTYNKLKPWLSLSPTIIISSAPNLELINSLKAEGLSDILVKSMSSHEQILRAVQSCITRHNLIPA